LIQFTVQLREARSQHFMAANQDTERLLKGIDIELALHPKGSGQVISGCIRLQFIQEPEHALGIGERK